MKNKSSLCFSWLLWITNTPNYLCLSSSMDLRLIKNCSLTVTLKHSVRFEVIRHTKVWKERHDQQDYLGFYNLDSHHLSDSVHGLLGKDLVCFNYANTVQLFLCFLIPYFIQIIFLQVSSTMALGLSWQTCIHIRTRRK